MQGGSVSNLSLHYLVARDVFSRCLELSVPVLVKVLFALCRGCPIRVTLSLGR